MSRTARFVECPKCERLMLGQRLGDAVYPQPHECAPAAGVSDRHEERETSDE